LCHAQVLLDVTRSLEHVHRMSLLHCDLKPANVSMQRLWVCSAWNAIVMRFLGVVLHTSCAVLVCNAADSWPASTSWQQA
jgi:hypothetical protein